jgi:DNA polymerase-3 subunit alpha
VRTTLVKNGRSAGRKMAMLTLEDVTGKCDAVVFSDVYEQSAELLVADAMLFVDGTVDRSRDRMSIKVDRVIPIEGAIEQLTAKVVLRLPPEETSPVLLEELRELLARHAGGVPVSLDVRPLCRPDAMVRLQVDSKWSVRPSQKLLDELTALLGDRGGPTLLRKALQVDRPTKGFRRRRPEAAAKGPASEAVTRFN